MAEKKMQIDNIKIIADILKDSGLPALKNGFIDSEKKIKDFRTLIDRKLAEIAEKKAQEAAEQAAAQAEQAVQAKEPAQDVTDGATELSDAEKVAPETVKEKAEADILKEQQAEPSPAPVAAPENLEKPAVTSAKPEVKEEKKMPSFIVRREFVPDKNASADRQKNRTFTPSDRPFGKKPEFNKLAGAGRRPMGAYVAPPVIPTEDKRNSYGKKNAGKGEKNFEEKRTLNKRALIKNNVTIDDFDENKTGYRKFRPVKKTKEQSAASVIKIEKAVVNSEIIPLKVLSEKIGITAAEITKRLFKEGIMKTINDSVDFDTAAFIADDIGVELELKVELTAEDVLSAGFDDVKDSEDKPSLPLWGTSTTAKLLYSIGFVKPALRRAKRAA